MNDETLADAVASHLDSLAKTIQVGLGVAVLFWWAGVQNQPVIEALGMDIRRVDALLVACIFYLALNIAVLDKFLRIGDLLREIDDSNLQSAVTKLATHPWIANPFAYFGKTFVSRVHSSKGFGTLIVAWWICNASLYTLTDNAFTSVGLLLQGVFLLVGLGSMQAIGRAYRIVLKRLETADPALYSAVKATAVERSIATFAGIGVGAVIAFLTLRIIGQ